MNFICEYNAIGLIRLIVRVGDAIVTASAASPLILLLVWHDDLFTGLQPVILLLLKLVLVLLYTDC
jgi:hypothetical protein